MRVIRVNNATVRRLIEEFTDQYTKPDAIKFVQDGNGAWITSVENIQNIRYVGIRQDFKQFLIDNGVNTSTTSLKEALETYGANIEYVQPPQEDFRETDNFSTQVK
jgi:hypothetical protein